ncbi:MAG: hypothetical protein DI527_07475 [Chelatococcus sp.]|nr:MAG: hypothetical protein DI527_07475 [Chelatococcus sp.]
MSKSGPRRETVAHLTYFVVQTFRAVKGSAGKISAEDPIQARDHDHAMRLVERYRPIRAGVVAFHRTGSPATGEWEDAVLIARHGQVSAEADMMRPADEADFESCELMETDLKVA